MNNWQQILSNQGQIARKAARALAITPTTIKNNALLAMADALENNSDEILQANNLDLQQEKKWTPSIAGTT